jgi:hypothetical protein
VGAAYNSFAANDVSYDAATYRQHAYTHGACAIPPHIRP